MKPMNQIEAKRVLVFNASKKLISIFYSGLAAAKAFEVHTQSIHYVCSGKCMSTKKHYFRYVSENIEVTLEDLGVLKLDEYDRLCGVERKVYPTRKMTRKGIKLGKRTAMRNDKPKRKRRIITLSATEAI